MNAASSTPRAADVDAAAAELADAEAARSEQVLRLSHSWGVPSAELTLTAIADRAPEGVAIALRIHRGRLHAGGRGRETTSAEVKRAVGVNLRNLNAVLAGVNGGAGTYTSAGRADTGNTRPGSSGRCRRGITMSLNALSTAVSGLRQRSWPWRPRATTSPAQGPTDTVASGSRPSPGWLALTPWGPMGTGVEVLGVSRSTDAFLDARARTTLGDYANLSTREDIGLRVEDAFGEPTNGVSSSLTRLWSAFADLATNPTDVATGRQVLSTLGDVAGRINAVRNDIDGITADATVRLSDEVDVVNDLSRRVADINRLSAGDAPPDLADERDRAIDQLSQLTGAKAEVAADGSIRVTVNGMAIVDGDRAMALRVDPANPGVVLHPAGPIVAGGVVGGLAVGHHEGSPGQRGRLDSFANTMMTALNAQHALNLKADGTAGGPLLADTGGTMTVVVTNPNQLAPPGASGSAQNGQGAGALAGLRTSIDSSARTMIGGVTNEVGALTRAVTSAKTTSESAAGSRDSVTGVNIDEEMTSLIAFQRSYAAAAKVITTVDAMLDTLIRM